MKNTCQTGNVTEARLLARFVENGSKVFIPFGEGHKCDLVFINDANDLKRVQIKTARGTLSGKFLINLYSNGGGYNKVLYTKSDIDYFVTEYEGLFYLLPVEDTLGKKTITLEKGNKYKF